MSTTAFVSTTCTSTWLAPSTPRWTTTPTASPSPRRAAAPTRRVSLRMLSDEPITTDATASAEAPPADTPSVDSTVFSDFVDSAQSQFEQWQQQLQDIDPEELSAYATETGKGLVDNFLAGDWLNRGELYGALQLGCVCLLLSGGGFFDGFVSLVTGPVLLALGAYASGKAVFDLGRKQLSIWPAPVPDGQLQTNGLYNLVRHPMYMGLLLASAGFSVATGSPARIAITVGFAALLFKKIDVEEDFLKEQYPDYEDYMEMVPYKILPKIY